MEYSNGPPDEFTPGRIRMIISGALEISIKDDPPINEKNLKTLLPQVSRILSRDIVLPVEKPVHGWHLTPSKLVKLIIEKWDRFEPILETPQDQNTESTECL